MPPPVYSPTNETRIAGAERRITRVERRPSVYSVVLEMKVFADDRVVKTGDGKFIFTVSEDCSGLDLVAAHSYVTFASGGVTVQLRNITRAWDMLSTRMTIDAAEYSSYTAAAAPVIDPTKNAVVFNERIAVDVDVAGATRGLGVILTFGRDRRP